MAGIGPTDWEKIINWVESLLGRELPVFVTIPLGVLVFLALLLSVVALIAFTAAKIRDVWASHLRPKVYSPEQKLKSVARRQFSQYLAEEIIKRNRTENWRDQQYAELEAEVEAEGQRRRLIPFLPKSQELRRERSLAVALQRSRERLVLVEGEPGSGKSVALRHLALQLAQRSAKSKSLASKLPVYVNLKELKREPHMTVDRELIKRHVLRSLNRVNDHFVDEFLEEEFDAGVKSGSWIFLFDSFDELPDVLSSIEADETTTQYSEAISDFLSVISECRGIVASRHYRGPKSGGWSTFRILPLTASRQSELIRKSLVTKPRLVNQVQAELAIASEDIRTMAQNPMLLGLLCEHMRLGFAFPAHSYEVMSKYVEYRLSRDEERVSIRYLLDPRTVMRVAESAAYVMTADSTMGLSPTLAALECGVERLDLGFEDGQVRNGLDALVYMRLARSEPTNESDEQEFTFSHRRFQEYFVTKMLLSGAQEVTPRVLLTDARWRETAVVLLQLAEPSTSLPLQSEVENLLAVAATAASTLTVRQDANFPQGEDAVGDTWLWPEGALHILSIVQAGTHQNAAIAKSGIGDLVAAIVQAAFKRGSLLDAKLALQVAGPAPEDVLADMMRRSLAARSRWLDDVVYLQASRLSQPDPSISAAIRRSIERSARMGTLRRTYLATRAYLSRLPDRRNFLHGLRLGFWITPVDLAVFAILAAIATIDQVLFGAIGTALAALVVSYLLERLSTPLSFAGLAAVYFRTISGASLLRSSGIWLSNGTFGMAVEVSPYLAFSYLALLIWWIAWRPGALLGIKLGVLVHPLAWVFLPFSVSILLGRTAKEIFKQPKEVLIMLPFIAAGLAIMFGFTLASIYYPATTLIVIGIMTAPVIAFFVWTSIILAYTLIADLRINRTHSRQSLQSIGEFNQFEASWLRMKTRVGRTILLRRLLRTNLPEIGAQWADFARRSIAQDPGLSRIATIESASFRAGILGMIGDVRGSTLPRAAVINPLLAILERTYLYEERDALFALLERAIKK